MREPDVSIVLPTFNRLACLRETVESVFSQTMQNWELIVADDGSEEDTIDYLDPLESDERVRLLRLEHSGNPGTARNAAIAAARAPYLAFLDSDDLWEPRKPDRQLAALRSERDCRWSYTAFTIVDCDGVPQCCLCRARTTGLRSSAQRQPQDRSFQAVCSARLFASQTRATARRSPASIGGARAQ